jgi:hypothetical protein
VEGAGLYGLYFIMQNIKEKNFDCNHIKVKCLLFVVKREMRHRTTHSLTVKTKEVKIALFLVVAPCSLVEVFTDVSEVLAASIIALHHLNPRRRENLRS